MFVQSKIPTLMDREQPFVLLTAHDTDKIKQLVIHQDPNQKRRYAIGVLLSLITVVLVLVYSFVMMCA